MKSFESDLAGLECIERTLKSARYDLQPDQPILSGLYRLPDQPKRGFLGLAEGVKVGDERDLRIANASDQGFLRNRPKRLRP